MVIVEPDRQCLLCNDWPSEPQLLQNGRYALICKGCGVWLPRSGTESRQGAITAWHRQMHPSNREAARQIDPHLFGYPDGFLPDLSAATTVAVGG